MAGLYPDSPSRRIAYDADGTFVAVQNEGGGAITELGASNKTELNDEDNTTLQDLGGLGQYNSRWVIFIFPEKRELDGVFASKADSHASKTNPGPFHVSVNTTNGVDGDWDVEIADLPNTYLTYTNANWRQLITSAAAAAKAGCRVLFAGSFGAGDYHRISATHLYGEISPGETPDRLLFLDTENGDAEFTKILDFAEIPRGQTQTRTFKLVNNSASKTINTIQVTAEDLYLNAGGWYTFGSDGIAYQSTHSVGNMSNGATELVYLKQSVGDGETLGLQTGRIKVTHASVT